MHWQDWVFSIGSWIFILALFPTIKGKNKPELSTSLTTGFILLVFTVCYFTLNLYLSAFSTFLTSASWFVLAYQKSQQKISIDKK